LLEKTAFGGFFLCRRAEDCRSDGIFVMVL
jgi:hypothetical protein